jgi:hypothetical protein
MPAAGPTTLVETILDDFVKAANAAFGDDRSSGRPRT